MKPKYFSQSIQKPRINRKPLQLQTIDPLSSITLESNEQKIYQSGINPLQPSKQNKINLQLNLQDSQENRESSFIANYLKFLQSPNRTTFRNESQTADRKSRHLQGRHMKKLSIHNPKVINSEDDNQYQIFYIGNEIKSSYQNSQAKQRKSQEQESEMRMRTCDSKSEIQRYNNINFKGQSVLENKSLISENSKVNSANVTSRTKEVIIKIIDMPNREVPLLDEWFQNKQQVKIDQQDPCYGLNFQQMYRYKDKSILNTSKSKLKKLFDQQVGQRAPSLLNLHRVYKEAKESSLKSYNQLVQLADKFMEKQKLKRKPLASHPVFKNQASHNPQFRLCSRLKDTEIK